MYRILIADDHDYVLEGLKFGLEGDFEVKTVPDGITCLEHYKSISPSPDIVMVDYRMDGLNGLEVMEALMKEPKPPAVILFSACLDDELEKKAMDRGAVDCMTKPFDLSELRDRLLSAVETKH